MTVQPHEFTSGLLAAGLLREDELADRTADDVPALAAQLVDEGRLTRFQAASCATGRPLVLGEYLLVDRLGVGGMGEVLRAVHRRMDRVVALKILAPHMLATPGALARFEREVRAAAKLVHPNIVTAYDAGEQDGVQFLVTEFVDGPDLNSHVVDRGPLAPEQAVDVLRQVAEGLRYAHGEGVVHRDIKPSNLLVDERGRVRILDMGIARVDDPGGGEPSDLTATGAVMGTLDYMSPEQALQSKDADARSDLYSLGCTLHFLMTTRPPFGGETVTQRLVAHREQPIPALRSLVPATSAELDAVHRRLMAKDPGERFRSAEELLAALADLPAEPITDAGRAASDAPGPVGPSGFTLPARSRGDVPDGETVAARESSAGTTETAITPSHERDRTVVDEATDAEASQVGPNVSPLAWIAGGIAIALVAGIVYWVNLPPTDPGGPLGTTPAHDGDSNVGDGHALRFNGTSSHVVVSTLDITAHETFTVELWVEIEERRTSNVVNWFGPGWFAIFQSGLSWGIAKEGSRPSPLRVAPGSAVGGRPTHVAATWDGSEARLFVDGRPLPTERLEYVPGSTESGFHIGGAPAEALPRGEEDRWFSGVVDEVRVTRGVRYTESFTPERHPTVEPETIALYRFDEGTGTEIRDASGNGHDGRAVDVEWTPGFPEP